MLIFILLLTLISLLFYMTRYNITLDLTLVRSCVERLIKKIKDLMKNIQYFLIEYKNCITLAYTFNVFHFGVIF